MYVVSNVKLLKLVVKIIIKRSIRSFSQGSCILFNHAKSLNCDRNFRIISKITKFRKNI